MQSENIQDMYPLSPMQQGMLFHSLYTPGTGVYIEELSCHLRGQLNVAAFEQSWQTLVARHPVLRTAFLWEDLDEPLQIVHTQVDLGITQLDWRNLTPEDQTRQLEALIDEEKKKGFDLSEAPLMRLTLIREADDLHRFVWIHHHILFDGWSLPLLLEEVFAIYEALSQGQPFTREPARPYRDYIAWLQEQDVQQAEMFWRQALRGFQSPNQIPIGRMAKKTAEDLEEYTTAQWLLSPEISQALHEFSRQHQLTLSTILQAAWALLLGHYSGDDDVVYGSIVSGRPVDLAGSDTMLGLFINTLPVRVKIDPQASLLSWLQELQLQLSHLRQFEYCSLIQIQGWSEVPRDLPLFHSILVFENYPLGETITEKKGSLQIQDIHSYSRTNYPLTFVVSPGKQIGLEIAYEPRRYDADTVQRMLRHVQQLLESFVANPEQKLSQPILLTEAERQQILVEWNQTQTDYPQDKCVQELFEAQVAQTPEAYALIFEDQGLSYQQLNARANQLAHYLSKTGVGPEVLVGICAERSPEVIIAMLAVLKAGGGYVPMDPNYPGERLAYIMEDSGAAILLTTHNLADKFPAQAAKIIYLDNMVEVAANENQDNMPVQADPENLAYVIYTSGSTGKPKGTLLNHRGLCNFISVFVRDLHITAKSRVLQFSSIGFDASVAEIFPILAAGGTLVLARQETLLSVMDLQELIRAKGITTATLPPSLLAVLSPDGLTTFKDLMSVGEACTVDIVNRWANGRNFWNGYGPTEATIGASWGIVPELAAEATSVPIGRTIGNKQIYILDSHLRPVPVGIPGELHIGGVGLARGYLNRPDLTAEKFIPNPFNGSVGERLYKTGDLARYLPDGRLEFVGRIDFQVKVRGFRIELGEIEAVLGGHPAVQMAAVIATDDELGNKRLVAYVTIKQGVASPAVTDFYQYLKSRLPDYMVPSAFMVLEQFPLTASGKVDRKRLPQPEAGRPELGREFVAPRTPTEELLAGVFSQVLGVEKVGIYDNFFELGGHSLLATQVLSRIREMFAVPLELREIFETPTIYALGRKIDDYRLTAKGIPVLAMTPVSRDGDLPLSFAQQRLWFLDQLEPNSAFYNIPTALRLRGRLNVVALEQSIQELIRRHESLRTTFQEHDGKPYQQIAPELALPMEKIELTGLPEPQREAEILRLAEQEAQQPFQLNQGPLLRCKLIKVSEQDHVFLLTMHHIISDAWSIGVLIREVAILYQAFAAGKPSPLPPLPLQYADFAHWQRNWLVGEVLDEQLAYWREQLKGAPPLLELPTDRPRPPVQTFRGKTVSFSLSRSVINALKAISQEEEVTLFMTLLAAFQTLLARYSGQNDISVGTPIANRNRLETENIIGFFVNTLVLRTIIEPEITFRELVGKVREVALAAYAHQDVPFEMLVEQLQPQRDLSHTPLFQVMFVFQNAPAQQFDLTDLSLSPVEAESGVAKFDLSIILSEIPAAAGSADTGMIVGFEYNTDLFDESTIQRLFDHFAVMLQGIANDPDQIVWHLPLLSETERQQILTDWNATAVEFPHDRCVHERFAQLAQEHPEAIAATYEGQQLTYAELNRRANQLARHLQTLGVKPDTPVGICMERSLEMVVGIMAALKAGGAFVPLDPVYPPERLAYMIEDSGIPVLLTQQMLLENLPQNGAKVIALDAEWEQIASQYAATDLPITTHPDHLAYVIYTSGSTGKPKGTMLGHRGLCNLAQAQQRAFEIRLGTKILQFSSLSFDAAVWETVMALLNLGTLCLAPRNQLASGEGLVTIMKEQQINVVTLPPSVVAVMPDEQLPDLKVMITAGEKCTAEIVSKWAQGRKFFNAYGPTETTVCASMLQVVQHYRQGPPIGRPIPNFQLYVLDARWQPVPIGVAGELCVGGVGLARGYLGRPDLTADKFIPHPFSSKPGERLYRTGDLVRYLPDGNVEFLGRIDFQVKVRGFRIELGEIEAVLGEHPDVLDVIVLVREDIPGDRRLAAYLVAKPGAELKIAEMRNYLRERLPEYMVPSHFMVMDHFPLTPNNKIDRKALPAPDQSRPDLEIEYVAPRTETEQQLAAICGELLNVKQVGIYDNFFDLGGHSLLATQFMSRLRTAFQVDLPLRVIFEKPRIADLAEEIDQKKILGQSQSQAPAIKRVSRETHRVSLAELQQK
jgi:amino acid adenylation domain-containing protein